MTKSLFPHFCAILVFLVAGSAVASTNFSGNGDAGFGGAVGKGTLTLSDDGTTIYGTITRGTNGTFNDNLVLFIDSVPGGFSDTSGFGDNADGLRRAISGIDTTSNRSILSNLGGFGADYAIALGPASATLGGLWSLANGGSGSLNLVCDVRLAPLTNNATNYTFSFPVAGIGLNPGSGATFRIFGTYVSSAGYRSTEALPGNVSGVQGWNTFNGTAVASYTIQGPSRGPAASGATVPWVTYEAEQMTISGTVLGPYYLNHVAAEASGRKCVRLSSPGDYAQFTSSAEANALVVRYSVPDTADGVGADYTLSLYTNGVFSQKIPMTSRYSWLYGAYPFTNNPSAGSTRNYYDETRVAGLSIPAGTSVRLQKDGGDAAANYVIDLVDLESVAPALAQPANSLSVKSYGAGGAGTTDDTTAFVNCISAAVSSGKIVWAPAGTYKISGTINLPSNTTLRGAGMWYTTLVGDPLLYTNAARRVALNGTGSNIHLSDFSILGRLNYRNDTEPNDSLGGSYGVSSTISRIWVEHSKTGAWLVNSLGLVVDGCRFRNTVADGINICVGMRNTIVTNCTARGTGDDCFATWPATYTAQIYTPGYNTFTHCTGQLPFLAQGGAIYGAPGNTIDSCRFSDIPYGCGVLISTTFPVGANVFSGSTTVRNCFLNRCGGYDGGFGWRGAVQFCLENSSLGGMNINNMEIDNSISDAFDIIAPNSSPTNGTGILSNSVISYVNIPNYSVAGVGGRGLNAISTVLQGSLSVSNCSIGDITNASTMFHFNITNRPTPASFGGILVNPDRSISVNYVGAPGYSYHMESTTNLGTGGWSMVSGSETNAPVESVYFTDRNESNSAQRYYRVVSP